MAACTVGDFKKMIEKMNISDDVVIECIQVESIGYSEYGFTTKAEFDVMEYDNGTKCIYSNNVEFNGSTIIIGSK